MKQNYFLTEYQTILFKIVLNKIVIEIYKTYNFCIIVQKSLILLLHSLNLVKVKCIRIR